MVPIAVLLCARWLVPIVICDDAYITFKVAANTAAGRGMVFNPGENTYVATSPMWVVVLAAGRLLIGDVVLAAKILGAVFEILLAVSIVELGARTHLGRSGGMFAALLLVTNPVFLLTSFSGMELPLYLLFIVLTALYLAERKHTVAILLGACAVWVRLDGFAVFGVAVAVTLWHERRQLRQRPARVIITVIPGTALALGSVIFAAVFFETWVPMSVQAKTLTAPAFLSPEWFDGAGVTAGEFVKAVLGKSGHAYTGATAFPAAAVFFVIGIIVIIVRKSAVIIPLVLITIAYITVFTLSGSAYTRHFPWYFVPVLPAAYLIYGAGIASALTAVSRRLPSFPERGKTGALCACAVMCWLAVAARPLYHDAQALRYNAEERERVYATAAVWAGTHIGHDVVIASDEIGTIGFFLPQEGAMEDMFGLLCRKETLNMPLVQRIEEKRPHCIIFRMRSHPKKTIDKHMLGPYQWYRYRLMHFGLRSDLAARLEPFLPDLHRIYPTVNMDQEYNWSSSRAIQTAPKIPPPSR